VQYDHIIDKSRVLLNKRVQKIDHRCDKVTVHCEDGSSFEGDIVVGADGVFSKIRQEMWRIADQEEPGAVPEEDRKSMRAEYQCLFGISKLSGIPESYFDVTYTPGFSTMSIVGKKKNYWFLFKKMDKVYKAGEIPKFTQADAEAFAERYANVNIMPKGEVKFRDLWENRTSWTLVATEEAEYKKWAHGRVVCLGDSVHKVTPNAGFGGNACIESAAALANAVNFLTQSTAGRPSLEAVRNAFQSYQKSRVARVTAGSKVANSLTRIHALNGLVERFLVYYIFPNAGDSLADMQSDNNVGATVIDYLPVPPRSLRGTMPFNPEHGEGTKEWVSKRALLALPFLAIMYFASIKMDPMPAFSGLHIVMTSGKLSRDSGELTLRQSFYGWKWLDDLLRPLVTFFAVWLVEADKATWWQMLTFVTDLGVLYAIILIESARRANLLTFAQMYVLASKSLLPFHSRFPSLALLTHT